MKVHEHVFHAVKGLKFVWVSHYGGLDGVEGSRHDPGLEVVNLHSLIHGIGPMFDELIIEIMLLDVLQDISVESKVLSALIISE